jgi:hypothetical protein
MLLRIQTFSLPGQPFKGPRCALATDEYIITDEEKGQGLRYLWRTWSQLLLENLPGISLYDVCHWDFHMADVRNAATLHDHYRGTYLKMTVPHIVRGLLSTRQLIESAQVASSETPFLEAPCPTVGS